MAYPVPHSGNLPFMLTEGKEIIVSGVVLPYADRFSINLCEGPTFDSTTALHFNPRLGQNQVVRSHQAGGWGPEETGGPFPFFKGAPYEVKIVVKNHAYQIFVNNTFFCEFNHRMPKESMRFLHVQGDTSINRIGYNDTASQPIFNPPVPGTFPIPGGLYQGKQIVFNGVPLPGCQRFSVNLVCGPSFDMNDIALHCDVRFDQNEVIRTHKQGGGWGHEEKQQNYFPFAHNTPFEIRISVENFGFRISVNNQFFTDFQHRLQPFQCASHVSVQGQSMISQIRFE